MAGKVTSNLTGKSFNALRAYSSDLCTSAYRPCVAILSGDGSLGERCNVNLHTNIGFVCTLLVNGFV